MVVSTFVLTRLVSDTKGVLGVLHTLDYVFATLEPPWLDNEVSKSCIPAGTYKCVKHASVRFGVTFEVKDVPNRSDILFHWGNYPRDTEGCILVGLIMDLHSIEIRDSHSAFSLFWEELQSLEMFQLDIVW